MKIKTKLQFSLLIIIFLIGAGGLISLYLVSESIKNTIGNEAILLNKEILSSLDESIYNNILESKELASDPRLIEALSKSNSDFANLENPIEYIKQQDQEWISSETNEITPFMSMIIDSSPSDILRQKSNFFKESYDYDVYPEIFLTNSYGVNVAQTGKTSDYMQNDEEWWIQAKQNGILIEDVDYDESADVFSIDISLRMDDENGNFLGVMKTVVNVEEVTLKLLDAKSQSELDSTQLSLFKRSGEMIFSTQSNNENLFLDEIHSIVNSNNKEGFFEIQNNQNRFISFAHSGGFSSYEGLEWVLVMSNDSNEILEPISQLSYLVGILTALIIGISILVNIIISKQIVKPINMLTNTANQLQEGNLQTRAAIQGNDEITTLSKAFNDMTDSIVEKTGQLNVKEQIEKTKDEFISMVAHELKTPLTPIIGWCDALKDSDIMGKLNEEQKRAVDTIFSNATRLEKLVGDLLDIQRLELGRMKFDKKPIQVSEMMNQITKNFEQLAKTQNVKIINLTKSEFTVYSDSKRLEQVLTNLINNALDFLDTKNPKIEIEAKKENNTIHFRVSDNGKGIPKNKQSEIFKKFYQQDTSQRREHGGAGLGLAICKGIVEGLGGKIWFDSKEGEGTNFYFSLKNERI